MTTLPLDGQTVLVTGTIDGLSRDEARNAVTALGGTPAAGVTGKVTLVVLGEGAGVSKTAKARALKIAVLDGDTFARLAADPASWDGDPLGMPYADYEAAFGTDQPEPEPSTDPAHRIGRAVLHAPGPDGTLQRQVRLSCSCGHKWMRHELHGDNTCPQPVTPTRTGPWVLTR